MKISIIFISIILNYDSLKNEDRLQPKEKNKKIKVRVSTSQRIKFGNIGRMYSFIRLSNQRGNERRSPVQGKGSGGSEVGQWMMMMMKMNTQQPAQLSFFLPFFLSSSLQFQLIPRIALVVLLFLLFLYMILLLSSPPPYYYYYYYWHHHHRHHHHRHHRSQSVSQNQNHVPVPESCVKGHWITMWGRGVQCQSVQH